MLQTDADATPPLAEIVVLRRIGEISSVTTVAEYAALQRLVARQVVSTGDRFLDFEVIEIVPPDEPARTDDRTIIEIS